MVPVLIDFSQSPWYRVRGV